MASQEKAVEKPEIVPWEDLGFKDKIVTILFAIGLLGGGLVVVIGFVIFVCVVLLGIGEPADEGMMTMRSSCGDYWME